MADITISQLGLGTPNTGIVVPWSDGINTYQAKLSSLITATGDMGTGAFRVPAGTTAQRPNSPTNGLIRYNTSLKGLEFYSDGTWIGIGLKDGSSYYNAADSAIAIKNLTGTTVDGLYWISLPGIGPVEVYCDMNTDGGGWMHVGTISDNNEPISNPTNHPWASPFNATQDTGIWQDSTTLGSQSFTSNFKSRAWSALPFSQFLIKDRGALLRNILYTNPGQILSNNTSFSNWWGSLSWGGNASDLSNNAYNAGRVKSLTITNFNVIDEVLESGNKTIILLKFGERDGVQDGNKDRSMIAWHRHNFGDNVDSPAGLGCFTLLTGATVYRNIIPYAQRADSPPSTITGTPYNFSIWIR